MDIDSLRDKYAGKCVMVTGGAGSVGTAIVKALLKLDAVPYVFDHSEPSLVRLLRGHNVDYYLGDVRLAEDIQRAISGCKIEHCIHAAAYKHVDLLEGFRVEAHRNNVLGARNLLDILRGSVDKLTLISTDKAVEPSSVMGTTKKQAEHEFLDRNQTVVRFGNVLFSSGSVLEIWDKQIQASKPITVTDPEMKRYLMTLDEAAGLVLHAAGTGGVNILRMGDPVTVGQLAQRFLNKRGCPSGVTHIIGTRPGEKKIEKLHSDTERLIETDHPFIYKVVH